MKLRRLLDALHARDLGEDFGEEAGFVQQFEGPAGMALGEHFGQLVADALAADGVDFRGEAAHGGGCGGFDLEAEAGGEAHGAQHAQMVLFKALLGLADGADDAGVEVGEAADIIDDGGAESFGKRAGFSVGGQGSASEGIAGLALRQPDQQQAVDGEIAAADIFFGAGGVADGVGMAAIGVGAIGAEGGDLGDHLRCGGARSCDAAASHRRRPAPRRSARRRQRCAGRG